MTDLRIVLVTGASKGIGSAIAKAFADDKHKVLVNYRSNEKQAQEVVDSIVALGGSAQATCFDVADSTQVEQTMDNIVKEFGGIDVLVNNAGVSIDQLILRAKQEDWDKIIQTNLTGSFLCSKFAAKSMMRRKNNGRIVFISSVVGEMGNPGQSMYAASKAGMLGLMKSLAKELASRNITVNAVAPGYVKTEMTMALTDEQRERFLKDIPMNRWAEPEEIAAAVKYLASKEAGYITGHTLSINGGLYI
ncbi:MAG TPA: 3-oxoacyl-[acyl-carrier-protein] reductase [Oligoflexia bacterium]|nr:3-oxoacyl-[acyl-carrier-protein] reductase [Oligoflexia bacterium]HMR25817.1 3-oxoacyl-[acyl-carrier-protein] reductase [Oligoflexia bacterium]